MKLALDLILERNLWITEEERVKNWYAMTRNLAYLAMAEFRLGNRKTAIDRLRGTLRYWDRALGPEAPYTPLQLEASKLVFPSAIEPTGWPKSEAFKAMDAVDASESNKVSELVGSEAIFKGRVVRVAPTQEGTRVNLVLDSLRDGLLVHARFDDQTGVTWKALKGFDGKEVVVTGELKQLEQEEFLPNWAHNRPQLEIYDVPQIQIIGDGNDEVAWWNVALRQIEAEEKANRPIITPAIEGGK